MQYIYHVIQYKYNVLYDMSSIFYLPERISGKWSPCKRVQKQVPAAVRKQLCSPERFEIAFTGPYNSDKFRKYYSEYLRNLR